MPLNAERLGIRIEHNLGFHIPSAIIYPETRPPNVFVISVQVMQGLSRCPSDKLALRARNHHLVMGGRDLDSSSVNRVNRMSPVYRVARYILCKLAPIHHVQELRATADAKLRVVRVQLEYGTLEGIPLMIGPSRVRPQFFPVEFRVNVRASSKEDQIVFLDVVRGNSVAEFHRLKLREKTLAVRANRKQDDSLHL